MRRALGAILGVLGIWPLALADAAPPAAAAPPLVVGVELVSPHGLPEREVREAIGALTGRPRQQFLIRETLDRLWALGLFSVVRVEERPEAGGVRLVFYLERRPHLGSVTFRGDLGLADVDLVEAAGLAPGGSAEPGRLEQAREAILARLRREGFRAARVEVQTRPDSVTNAHDVTFVVAAGDRARIGSVQLTAEPPTVAELVRAALGLREGRPYRDEALRDGLQAAEARLRQAGFFEARVSAEPPRWDAGTNRVDLVVHAEAGSHFRVEFAGATALDEKRLRERLTFPHTGTVDEPELRASARQLEAAYREAGYHFVTVTPSVREKDRGRVIRFDIVEGPRVVVESVEIEGQTTEPPDRLLAQMQTRPPRLIHRGRYRAEALERDVQAIQTFLRSRGFPDAKVGPARMSFSEDRSRVRITIPVEEGPRVRVGAVVIDGARIFSAQELSSEIPLEPGQPWSAATAEEGRRVLERRYARRGFLNTRVAVEATRRDDVQDVVYRIDEGPQTRIGRILLSGLTRTKESVVVRELPFREGDPFNPEDLVRAQRRLGGLGVFERVDVEPLRPPPVPYADVHVTVREGKPWHVGFGAGYATYEGLRGFVEGGHDNLFGIAHSLRLRLQASERGERGDLAYGVPRIFDTLWRGEADVFYEHRTEIGYDFQRVGTGLEASRELNELLPGLRISARYELAQVDRFNIEPTLLEEDVERGRELLSSIEPELSLERRDNPLDPTRGSFHLIAVELGGVVLGGDSDFVKTRLETHWFFSWLPPTVVVLSGRLGVATPLRNTTSLPIEERFFAGGSGTVRGYRERRLGPRDNRGNPAGGNGLAVFNAEWRFPIWRWLGGTVFFDTGTVTDSAADLSVGALVAGVGGGLRLVTPVGPIRLDVGYPLDRIHDEEQTIRFYLTVGHPF
ncbi:MAG TPA: outer membrane protein assembly factor BamA [Methylomirabilota bacterium]|nr:outer membrane protein assembly factor BamA [Methylomirabilota bacterium]